jgi:hypothetical protein
VPEDEMPEENMDTEHCMAQMVSRHGPLAFHGADVSYPLVVLQMVLDVDRYMIVCLLQSRKSRSQSLVVKLSLVLVFGMVSSLCFSAGLTHIVLLPLIGT